jgi:hypothetical protein
MIPDFTSSHAIEARTKIEEAKQDVKIFMATSSNIYIFMATSSNIYIFMATSSNIYYLVLRCHEKSINPGLSHRVDEIKAHLWFCAAEML